MFRRLDFKSDNKPVMKHFKIMALALLALICHVAATAQKLPSEQKSGMYAPKGIRIDGKLNEWGSQLQAFNRQTNVFYSVANDDKNFYLVIRCEQQVDISKILGGGITLALKSTKNNNLPEVTLNYPIITYLDKPTISIPLREETDLEQMVVKLNQRLLTVAKYIKVSGIAAIKDTSVAIYNDLDIKAVAGVDTKRAYIYELQVPLRYFSHLIDQNDTFVYNVIVNGITLPQNSIIVGGTPAGGVTTGRSVSDAQIFDLFSPTDFKASYKLFKQ